jgi:16S rRNA G966 N2-methylase RsmD
MYENDKVPEYLCDEEKWLIGFCINQGSAYPKKTAKKFNCWNKQKIYIANNLYKIKHWLIKEGSYEELKNYEATWFIDPPYQFGGKYYKFKNIDYNKLSHWCKTRKGQVIVCENMKADWLPFKPLKQMYGQKRLTIEAIWYKED